MDVNKLISAFTPQELRALKKEIEAVLNKPDECKLKDPGFSVDIVKFRKHYPKVSASLIGDLVRQASIKYTKSNWTAWKKKHGVEELKGNKINP